MSAKEHPIDGAPSPKHNNASRPGPPHPIAMDLGVGPSRKKSYLAGRYWIDCWLGSSLGPDYVHPNLHWPTSLDALTLTHIEGDHLLSFCTEFGAWFARNQFETRQKGTTQNMLPSSKLTFFKTMKNTLSKMISGHPYLTSTQDRWWTEIIAAFSRENTRAAVLDPEVIQERHSEPLYRDITGDTPEHDGKNMATAPEGLIRSKYRGKYSHCGTCNISRDITIFVSDISRVDVM